MEGSIKNNHPGKKIILEENSEEYLKVLTVIV